MTDVVIVGSGNVAEAFASAVARCEGLRLAGIYARNRECGAELALRLGTTCSDRELMPAEVYIIAVSDRAVEEVAHALPFPREALVLHTAGSIPMEAIPEREGGRGIIYPLQSFSRGRDVELSGVPLFIEADSDEHRVEIERVASLLSSRVEYAASHRRRVIHLAGVFVNNFVNHLYSLGSEILASEGLDFSLLEPLIRETADKAIASGSPQSVQTGPAVRGDSIVTAAHMELLAEDKLKSDIYRAITKSIWETSKRI
jgi:predicted short-subunit dehydrogenase-like oxidoreductase (DUF2520 family)